MYVRVCLVVEAVANLPQAQVIEVQAEVKKEKKRKKNDKISSGDFQDRQTVGTSPGRLTQHNLPIPYMFPFRFVPD